MARRKKKKFQVLWRYHAGPGAVIWQMMFTGSGCLAGQKRFPESRRLLLFTIDTLTGALLADDCRLIDPLSSMPVGDGWFAGFEAANEKLVFCHAYQADSPEHKGIWAFDPASGSVVWGRPDIVFAANLGNELLVYRPSFFAGFPERHFFLVDPSTGSVQRELGIDNPEINDLRENTLTEEERQQVILPEFPGEDKRRALFLSAGSGIAAQAPCEYLEIGDVKVIALHEPGTVPDTWNSSLHIFNDGYEVYHETMASASGHPVVNNFLIRGDNLYYIKEKEELVCVSLS
ncbi:MAG: DUF4905 domain-containing protein [Chlorobiaceae bacterium]|jgi:hypothetical protein|nr:DUF4905 domain-containing protein [Chlorobiaceae bacterium]